MADTFSDASAGALASLSGDQPSADPTPVDPGTALPSGGDSSGGMPPVGPTSYKVKVQNEEVDVPLDELLKGYSRTGDYTKKAMALAEQRRVYDQERQAFDSARTQAQEREQKLQAFLSDANQIKAYYEYMTNQQLEAAGVPDIQQQLAQQRQALEAQVNQVQQATQQQLKNVQDAMQAQRASEMSGDLTKTIKSLLENPDLKILSSLGDDVGDILCGDAMRLGPTTVEEAKVAIRQVAEARAERMNSYHKEMLKAGAVNAAKLKTQGIEPPGGAGVSPGPKKLKLNSKELSQAATDFVSQTMQK